MGRLLREFYNKICPLLFIALLLPVLYCFDVAVFIIIISVVLFFSSAFSVFCLLRKRGRETEKEGLKGFLLHFAEGIMKILRGTVGIMIFIFLLSSFSWLLAYAVVIKTTPPINIILFSYSTLLIPCLVPTAFTSLLYGEEKRE